MCKLHSTSHHAYLKKVTCLRCKSLHFVSEFRLCCTRSLCLGFQLSVMFFILCIYVSLSYVILLFFSSGYNFTFGGAYARAESFCTKET
jgi:hypothetical protein